MMREKHISALSWPFLSAQLEGWALVLILRYDDEHPEKDYEITIGPSCSSPIAVDLVNWAIKQEERGAWHGDAMDKAVNVMSYAKAPLSLSPAPYVDRPYAAALYLQILKQFVGEGGKRLKLGSSEIGRQAMEQMIDLQAKRATTVQNYPAIAVLSYGLAAAYLWIQMDYPKIVMSYPQYVIVRAEDKDEGQDWGENYELWRGKQYGDAGFEAAKDPLWMNGV